MKKLLLMPLLLCSILGAVNPSRAMIYSAVVPGAGQIYNEAYAKAGIVIGLQAWNIGKAVYNDGKASEYADKASVASDPFYQQFYKDRSREYREKRTSDIWWIGITAALSALDAYVDAHLSNFDSEREKLHLRFEDGRAGFQINF